MPRKIVQLNAKSGCSICGGRGHFAERHDEGPPEAMICECVLDNAPNDPETQAAIDAGDYEINSAHPEDNHDFGRYW